MQGSRIFGFSRRKGLRTGQCHNPVASAHGPARVAAAQTLGTRSSGDASLTELAAATNS